MATYNTYQEAKIANPESEIAQNSGNYEPMENIASSQMYRWRECNPADYCMSEEDFIAGGYSYLNGDVIYSEISGLVLIIGIDVSIADMDWNDGFGHKRYILRASELEAKPETPFLQTGEDFEHSKTLNFIRDRLVEVHGEPKNLDYMHKLNNAIAFVEDMENKKAACDDGKLIEKLFDGFNRITAEREYESAYDIACDMLELEGELTSEQEKPKRTKVSYEKVEFDSAWEAIKSYEINDDLYYCASSTPRYEKMRAGNMKNLLDYSMPIRLYRRIETEITEREEFIEAMIESLPQFDSQAMPLWVGKLYDSGKFKLVN